MTSVEIFYDPSDSWSTAAMCLILSRRGNRIPEGQFVFLLVASHPRHFCLRLLLFLVMPEPELEKAFGAAGPGEAVTS